MSVERSNRVLSAKFAAAVMAAALLISGCGAAGASTARDNGGGAGEPMVLGMANSSSGFHYHPALQLFVDRVAELSDGALRIDVHNEWGAFEPDAEQQIVGDVASGEIELGWVGTRVFDTLGVSDFQALTAPMLIDHYPLLDAVIDAGIPAEMFAGVDAIGVEGIAVVPDGLRKPMAVERPLLGPDDYDGITFQAFRSNGHADAIRALGATPTDVFAGELDAGLRGGTINGFEKGLRIYRINGMELFAPYVTANVNLWPHTLALIANPDAMAELTDTQREWLRQAGSDAVDESAALADDETELASLCETGARFENASAADLDSLRAAFAPVYAALEQDPKTATFIERIIDLAGSTERGPDLLIPAGCSGPADFTPPVQSTGVTSSKLDGTYRVTITPEDAAARRVDWVDGDVVMTLTIADGRWSTLSLENGRPVENGPGSVSITGDQIVFDWSWDPIGSMSGTFSLSDRGDLTFTPDERTSKLPDPFLLFWATHPWTKIAGVSAAAETLALNGTYRWTVTEADARASGSPNLVSAENLAWWPAVATMTLDDGTWEIAWRGVDGQRVTDGPGKFEVDGDRITFDWPGPSGSLILPFTFVVGDDGTLDLEPAEPMAPDDAFIWSFYDWQKIAGGAEAPPETNLDGTYRWTITRDDAIAHGTPNDRTADGLATFPWIFTITMTDGTWDLRHRDGEGDWNDGGGPYRVESDTVVFEWPSENEELTFLFEVAADGSLQLEPDAAMHAGNRFVWATNDWVKIG